MADELTVTGWCAQQEEAFTYVSVDLGSVRRVKAIMVKGVVTNDVVSRPTEIRVFFSNKIRSNQEFRRLLPQFQPDVPRSGQLRRAGHDHPTSVRPSASRNSTICADRRWAWSLTCPFPSTSAVLSPLLDLAAANVPRCLHCPVGTSAVSGAKNCALCPPGSYQDQKRFGSCKRCPAGTHPIGKIQNGRRVRSSGLRIRNLFAHRIGPLPPMPPRQLRRDDCQPMAITGRPYPTSPGT